MPSSNKSNAKKLDANPYTKKRRWITSTAVMVLASVGGALGINFLWLNPPTDANGTAVNATKTQTVTGDPIQYRYGTMQLEVTATDGKIEKITELQATSSPGWEQAIPMLNQAAIEAQGATFGNLSGATYIADAYRQALTNALQKLK